LIVNTKETGFFTSLKALMQNFCKKTRFLQRNRVFHQFKGSDAVFL